jgi:hypothetical protein
LDDQVEKRVTGKRITFRDQGEKDDQEMKTRKRKTTKPKVLYLGRLSPPSVAPLGNDGVRAGRPADRPEPGSGRGGGSELSFGDRSSGGEMKQSSIIEDDRNTAPSGETLGPRGNLEDLLDKLAI